jgi:hypothetical protein
MGPCWALIAVFYCVQVYTSGSRNSDPWNGPPILGFYEILSPNLAGTLYFRTVFSSQQTLFSHSRILRVRCIEVSSCRFCPGCF